MTVVHFWTIPNGVSRDRFVGDFEIMKSVYEKTINLYCVYRYINIDIQTYEYIYIFINLYMIMFMLPLILLILLIVVNQKILAQSVDKCWSANILSNQIQWNRNRKYWGVSYVALCFKGQIPMCSHQIPVLARKMHLV